MDVSTYRGYYLFGTSSKELLQNHPLIKRKLFDFLRRTPFNLEKRLEDVDPNTYKDEIAWRDRLESEYLSYHNEFRKRKIRIPHPGWVSEYVEEILSLGYETQLGN